MYIYKIVGKVLEVAESRFQYVQSEILTYLFVPIAGLHTVIYAFRYLNRNLGSVY